MRRLFMACVLSLMLMGLAACAGQVDAPALESQPADETAAAEPEKEAEKNVFDAINERAAQPVATERAPRDSVSQSFNTDLTGIELVKDMKIGWNLGNTFDGPNETAWAGVKTTPEIIGGVHAAGFKTLRLPVTWGSAGKAKPANDYTIDLAYLDRVEDVANYALDNGMYVILNAHHDTWVSGVSDENAATAISRVWTQVSERFKGYDERLIFETFNEPRWVESDWTGNDEAKEKINALNKTAVDVIRASGGNNAHRFIMVPGYAAAASYAAVSKIVVPNGDPRIIISTHAYNPFDFCMPGPRVEWGSDSDIENLREMFTTLNDVFIEKGIPVVMGEFGAVNKDNEDTRALWAKYYIGFAAQYGIPCVWWDNNSFGNAVTDANGESFGLYRRGSNEIMYPKVLAALMEGLTWTPAPPEEKGAVLYEYLFDGTDHGITVELDNGATWADEAAPYAYAELDGQGALRVNADYHGEWEITRFSLPADDIPLFAQADRVRYEILIPKTAVSEIGWAQFSTCFSTSLNGWIQSGETRELSTASFNDDYFRLPMEEPLTNIRDLITGSEYFTLAWINYGWIFDEPIYLTNITFLTDTP